VVHSNGCRKEEDIAKENDYCISIMYQNKLLKIIKKEKKMKQIFRLLGELIILSFLSL
jgi:hypothetical protein